MTLLFWLFMLWQWPQSLLGLFFWLLGDTYVHDVDGAAVFLVARPGGLAAWWLARENPTGQPGGGSAAITCGAVIVCAKPEYAENKHIRAHEKRHVQQGNWFGPFFWLVYGAAMLVTAIQGKLPLRDNWFERDADAAEERE